MRNTRIVSKCNLFVLWDLTFSGGFNNVSIRNLSLTSSDLPVFSKIFLLISFYTDFYNHISGFSNRLIIYRFSICLHWVYHIQLLLLYFSLLCGHAWNNLFLVGSSLRFYYRHSHNFSWQQSSILGSKCGIIRLSAGVLVILWIRGTYRIITA